VNERRWSNAQVVANWVIAILTGILAVIAWNQYWWFKSTERPWIGSMSRAIGRDEQGRIGGVNWGYMSGGKTAAKNVRIHLPMMIGDPIPKTPDEIKIPHVEECSGGASLPGKTGLIVLPGIGYMYAAFAPQNVIDSAKSIAENRVGLYFVGCLDYEDQSGENHRTYVCEYYSRTADRFELCPRGVAASY
jgi:hypothetical protein